MTLAPAVAARLRLQTATAAGETYDSLFRNALRLPVDAGIQVRVAAIEDLVRDRRARGERGAAAILRATLVGAAERLDAPDRLSRPRERVRVGG